MKNILINNVNIRVVRETRNGLQAAVKASAIFIAAFDTTRTRINNNKKRRRVSPTRARGAGGAGKTWDIEEMIKQVSQVLTHNTPSAASRFLAAARCFAPRALKSVAKRIHEKIFIELCERCNAAIVLSLLSLVVKKKKNTFEWITLRFDATFVTCGFTAKKGNRFCSAS